MKALFTFFFSLFTLAAIAQIPAPNLLSLKVYEGSCATLQYVSKQLDGGFILNIEATSNIGSVDSLCSITDDRTIFLKYNSDASILEWSKCYAGNGSDSVFSYMFSTSDGGYILGGIGNGATHNFLIHKEDATGAILWSKSYGDAAEAVLKGMTPTSDQGYILIGEVYYTNVDFPIHYGSNMVEDIAVIKVDSNGNKVWSTVIGGTLSDVPGSVINAPGNGCYIVGSTTSNDHDCVGNHDNSDAYLVRLDNNGNILWHKDLGGTGYDGGEGAWPDGSGGVIIAGNTNSHDGDITHYVGGIWVLDVDSSGAIRWNNSYGNGGAESPTSICKAIDGSIWIAGTSGTKGGEIDTVYGNTDSWFVHTDSIGNFLNAKVLGSHKQDVGTMIYPLSNGNIIAGGHYDTTGCVFPFIAWGGGGAFLTIFAPWPESVREINAINNVIKIYPNPANEKVTVETTEKENYTVIVTDVVGRKLYNGTLIGQLQIPVNNWRAGIYYVQVNNAEGYRSEQKLIVQ